MSTINPEKLIRKTLLEKHFGVSRNKLLSMFREAGIEFKTKTWYITPAQYRQLHEKFG